MDELDEDYMVFAPSFVAAWELEQSGHLDEGKSLGTSKHSDLYLAKHLLTASHYFPSLQHLPPKFAEARKKGITVGKRKLKEVQARTLTTLLSLINKWHKSKLDENEFRKQAVKAMKTAWRDVFLAGLRAGGVEGQGAGPGKSLVEIGTLDDKWLKSAMKHEMRFLNGFLDAVVRDDYKMPLAKRAGMYVDALESFYNSARVIALPGSVMIWWLGPNDKRTCPGCRYMFEHSPFTKLDLPTTPRSGMTPCLTNCRDRLLIRRVAMSEVQKRLDEADYTRGGHIKNLRTIKRTGKPLS